MREVTIQFMGPIRRPPGMGNQTTIPVADDATAEAVLESLGYDEKDRSRLRVLIGGRSASLTEQLGSAQELTIFLPLGGG